MFADEWAFLLTPSRSPVFADERAVLFKVRTLTPTKTSIFSSTYVAFPFFGISQDLSRIFTWYFVFPSFLHVASPRARKNPELRTAPPNSESYSLTLSTMQAYLLVIATDAPLDGAASSSTRADNSITMCFQHLMRRCSCSSPLWSCPRIRVEAPSTAISSPLVSSQCSSMRCLWSHQRSLSFGVCVVGERGGSCNLPVPGNKCSYSHSYIVPDTRYVLCFTDGAYERHRDLKYEFECCNYEQVNTF